MLMKDKNRFKADRNPDIQVTYKKRPVIEGS